MNAPPPDYRDPLRRGQKPAAITVRKLTDLELLREACESTMQEGAVSQMSLDEAYRCEHSPMRTQLFWLSMPRIPTFVSVHCVRHKIGVEHFVRTNRDDRGGDPEANRHTPVRHSVLLNAEAFISIARKRLCFKAAAETRALVLHIKEALRLVDPDLARYMVPNCVYRGGLCVERKPCGQYRVRRYEPSVQEMEMEI